jgi:hypothetical protein
LVAVVALVPAGVESGVSSMALPAHRASDTATVWVRMCVGFRTEAEERAQGIADALRVATP